MKTTKAKTMRNKPKTSALPQASKPAYWIFLAAVVILLSPFFVGLCFGSKLTGEQVKLVEVVAWPIAIMYAAMFGMNLWKGKDTP